MQLDHCNKITPDHIGLYAQLGGHGLMNGIACKPNKASLYKIIGVVAGEKINFKAYRAKNGCYLPSYQFKQAVILYTKKEFKDFPVY